MLKNVMEHYFFFKLHFSLTLYMTGIIWLIQVIHYPLFSLVGEKNFEDYHKSHIQKTSSVIAIPMVLELLTVLYLLIKNNLYRSNLLFLINFSLLVITWIITFLISVPRHDILSKGHNELAIKTLVNTNWIRTIAWTLRAVILFTIL